MKNKHIPIDYKCNERSIQLKLLAGIIDSDGNKNDNCYDIIQKNEKLMDDIIYLCRSLGFAAYKSKCEKSCKYKGHIKTGTYYRTTIHGYGLHIPVKCVHKYAKKKANKGCIEYKIKLKNWRWMTIMVSKSMVIDVLYWVILPLHIIQLWR